MRYVYLFISTLTLGAAVCAQTQALQGELTSDRDREFNRLTIELQSAVDALSPIERAFVSQDGHFEFRGVPPGHYRVVIRDFNGAVIHQDYVAAQGFSRVSLRLPESKLERPATGFVSLQELAHQPPKAARKAFEEARRKMAKEDPAAATALLERAVQLDPEYLHALNNLGAQYVRLSRHQEALQCFRRAIALSPRTPMLHANLAQALLFLKDYEGAENSARQAIALDATDPFIPRAELALGLALAGKGETVSARSVLQACSRSGDEAVRRAAQAFLSGNP